MFARFLALALLVCFLAGAMAVSALPVSAQPSFEATALWGSPQSQLLAAPGSTSLPLYLAVYNLGPVPAQGLSANFTASYPLVPVRGESKSVITKVPLLPAGSDVVLIGYYNVSSSAQVGVYNQSVRVSFLEENVSFTVTVPIEIPILGNPLVSLSAYSYTPSEIYPGYTRAALTAYLVDSGSSPAANVKARLSTSYPVYPAYNGSNSVTVGYLPVGEPVPVNFALGIVNTTSGVNTTLYLTVSYNNGKATTFSIPFVEGTKANLQVVAIYTPTMRVGDGADYVTITLRNTGSAAALLPVFTLLPSNVFQPSVPSSENPLLAILAVNVTSNSIPAGSETNVTYVIQVSPNIPEGTYPLTILATWRQQGSTMPFYQEISVNLNVHPTLLQSLLTFTSILGLNAFEIVLILVIVVLLIALGASARRKPAR